MLHLRGVTYNVVVAKVMEFHEMEKLTDKLDRGQILNPVRKYKQEPRQQLRRI